MTAEQLRRAVGDGSIDTVLLVFADMQGRLQGKRLVGKHFVEEVLEHDAEACNYLLAVDVDMNTVEGYTMSSWSTGYGDFVMKPDLETLRPGALARPHRDVHGRPRVARRVAASSRRRGRSCAASSTGSRSAAGRRWPRRSSSSSCSATPTRRRSTRAIEDLVPGNQYNVDYSILGTSRLEPLIGRIRREMAAAGLEVENSKGECNFGQHEINFTYEGALGAADTHTIYKNGAKEIASQEGAAITFMAKYNEREGNSCHIHLSLRTEDDKPVFADQPELFDRFLAGQLACLRELTLFKAPNINSYKRFAEGSFAPTAVAWGRDNRTCSMRVIGEGQAMRIESRLAGGDVNPYLAIAAMIASGLHGIDSELELEPALEGNAYTSDKPHVPIDAAGRPRPVRGERRGARGVRRGGRRALPQQRRRRAARVRGRRDGLGALAGLRAAVTLTVLEPATEEVLAEIPRAGAEEADAAVARAKAAYPAWRAVAPRRPRRAAAPAGRRAGR